MRTCHPCLLLLLAGVLVGEDHRFDCRLVGAWSHLRTTVDRSTEAKPDSGYDPAAWRTRSTLSSDDASTSAVRLDVQALFADRLADGRPWWLLWGAGAGATRQSPVTMPLIVADPEEGPGSRQGGILSDEVGVSSLACGPVLGLGYDQTATLRFELVGAIRIGIADVGFRSAQPLVGSGAAPSERTVTGRMWDWSAGCTAVWSPAPWQCIVSLGWMDAHAHARFVDYNAVFTGTGGTQGGIFKEDAELRSQGWVLSLGVGRRW